ncbi:ABC transporter permease [Mucilaginibacter daejeonensis]|uniref:ABC transporter permease n=1 Tax=Mucilaginibacter daejeonensis TaxID=398049 RepID=UPI001D1744FF|nr:ABC transporter permease [Mucilaginibacter daejeonensis]UEG52730.1 ABC transporter permease [Mucilaginibacter daejeonensis]
MLKNYIKIAWRNLLKNKVYSFINILGLALGMAVAILIGLWMWDELSFDTYHDNYDTIAQVKVTQVFSGHNTTHEAVALPLAQELRTKYPNDIKRLALSSWNETMTIKAGDQSVSTTGVWAQPDLAQMLTIKMVNGSLGAVNDPSSVLIARSLARSLFGNADPLNKTIKLNNKTDVKVAGVYEDLPQNTTFHDIKIFCAWERFAQIENWVRDSAEQWDNHSFRLFAQVNDGADISHINAKIKEIATPHKVSGDDKIQLHPMSQWHLYDQFTDGRVSGGRIKFVWLFGIIGVFVLLLACINFMNLSTARSEKRAKEVGIRRSIGSLRVQIIAQFLSESMVMVSLAFLLSVIMVLIFLPVFNTISDKQIQLPWLNPVFWIAALVFTIITGLLSGSYPALYLSAFDPVKVLKGTFKAGRFSALPRKVLVVIQFTVSITLIIGTIIVYKQIQYAKNRPVGYDREGLISVEINTPELAGHYDALRGDLVRTGVVQEMAESSSRSTSISSSQIGFDWKGKEPGSIPVFGTIAVTHDYGKTIGWSMRSGRDFSRDFATDSSGIILNTSAVKTMGFKQPLGQVVVYNGKPLTVVGVVNDMIMESPYLPTQPSVFMLNYNWANIILVKLKPGVPVRSALDLVEAVFKRFNPEAPFIYDFTDSMYAQKFRTEERIGDLATLFAVLAILISSLGLFGLASFVAEQRTKEIGVRKVLGASVYNLWSMLSKDFVILVLIACAIAVPFAWYFLDQWLQAYEYRTSISWWIFAVSGIGALVITLLTVSFQAIKAALTNPVKSLRTE